MDPATALTLLALQPVRVDPHAVLLPGSFAPIVLPLDGLPMADRTAWLADAITLPIERRVAVLLECGRIDDAFRLAGGSDVALIGPLAEVFKSMLAQERTRLGLPADDVAVLALPGSGDARHVTETAAALATVTEQLPLCWPRWIGPLVVMGPEAAHDPMPGRTWMARPVLPIMRCHDAARDRIAAELVRMCLAGAAPPAAGWPPWLRTGMAELIAGHVLGHPASPRLLRERLGTAGPAGLRALFTAADPEMELAMAVCAPLILPANRLRFRHLLDLLRNGASSEGALRVAYGWTPERLAAPR